MISKGIYIQGLSWATTGNVVLYTHCQNLKGCIETLTGFIHVYCPYGLNSTSLSRLLFTQSYPTLCDPVDCSTPGFPVLHYLPEFAQTHVHGVALENYSHHGTKGRIHSKDRRGHKEPLIAWVQLEGQQAILTTSQMTSSNKVSQSIRYLHLLLTWGGRTLITFICPHLIRTSLNNTLLSGIKASNHMLVSSHPLTIQVTQRPR